MDVDFGIHNSPYEAEAIRAAIEATELRSGYMKTIREICGEHGYNVPAFRRWLHRNGIKSVNSKYVYDRKQNNPAIQFIVNFDAEEKELVEKYMRAGGAISRTDFVRKAVASYIEKIKKQPVAV